jgi:hypothetical protein
MATEKQIAANRANAQNSCGPKTAAGKEKSSMNHLSWGFCSNTILIPGEDPAEFDGLLNDLLAQHQPANVTEQILVEKMAQNKWLSDRAFRLQSYAFIDGMLRGEKFAVPPTLSVLIRYRTSSDNAFHKAHNELVKAQKERKKSEIGFESQTPSDTPATQPENDPKITPITWGQEAFHVQAFQTDEEILADALGFDPKLTENAA